MRIRVDDTVEVICGDDQGTRGKVMRIDLEAGRIVVEGVNKVFKHVRRSQKNPQGGRLSRESTIALANVLFVCPACNHPVRLGARVLDDGSKERFCRGCGASAGQMSPAKARRAKT